LCQKEAPDFENRGGSSILRCLNDRSSQFLQANHAFARKLFYQHDEIELGIPLAKGSSAPRYAKFNEALAATLDLLYQQKFETVIEIRFTPYASEAMLGPGTGGATCYLELAPSLRRHSRSRIAEVFRLFDTTLREKFEARPHLGKKTWPTFQDMEGIYGETWKDFNDLRSIMDPNGKFLPPDNEFLQRVFTEPRSVS
jgi:hypothetical protein